MKANAEDSIAFLLNKLAMVGASIVAVAMAGVGISWAVNIWQSSNPHETTTYIEATPAWMDGEIRTCSSFPVNKVMMGNPAGYAFGSLRCGDGNDIYRQF